MFHPETSGNTADGRHPARLPVKRFFLFFFLLLLLLLYFAFFFCGNNTSKKKKKKGKMEQAESNQSAEPERSLLPPFTHSGCRFHPTADGQCEAWSSFLFFSFFKEKWGGGANYIMLVRFHSVSSNIEIY